MKYCPICEKNYGDDAQSCESDGATLRESGRRDTLVGKIIKGRYQVLEKIGEGGMGAVYLAEQVAISRKVALKVLHADYVRDENSLGVSVRKPSLPRRSITTTSSQSSISIKPMAVVFTSSWSMSPARTLPLLLGKVRWKSADHSAWRRRLPKV